MYFFVRLWFELTTNHLFFPSCIPNLTADEFNVNLDLVDIEIPQHVQRGVAFAEIIHGNVIAACM